MDEIVVRWGSLEDEGAIAHVLGLNSMSGRNVLQETYIIAEKRGEIMAVARCLMARKHLVVGPLAVDPWAGEHCFAVALYSGAGALAQEMGFREVWAECDEHQEYLLEVGYRRRVGGWHLDTRRSLNEYETLPERSWRRLLSLWGTTHVPFFRAFRS